MHQTRWFIKYDKLYSIHNTNYISFKQSTRHKTDLQISIKSIKLRKIKQSLLNRTFNTGNYSKVKFYFLKKYKFFYIS